MADGSVRVALVGPGSIEIPPAGYGAVEEYVWNLARALPAQGIEAEILHRVPPFRGARWRELASAALLPFDLRGRSFDLLHVQTPLTSEALPWSQHRVILTSHSRYWLTEPSGRDRLWRLRDALAVRRAAGVIALAPQVVDRFRALRRGRPTDRVRYIPFGVDTDRFHPRNGSDGSKGVVGLGEVVAHKRFDVLAAAARRAGVPATVIGRIRDPRARDRALALNPEVRFLGEVPRDDLARELAEAQVFVHPSEMELASVATVQAMACGLPVVGSDLLGGIVTEGVDGFLIDHAMSFDHRVESTAEALRRLVQDPVLRTTMGDRARTTAVDQHGWPAVAAHVAAFYRRVLGKDGSTRRRS